MDGYACVEYEPTEMRIRRTGIRGESSNRRAHAGARRRLDHLQREDAAGRPETDNFRRFAVPAKVLGDFERSKAP